MKQFQYTIKDALGVHARPAGLLVKLAKQYTSTITLEKNGKTCDMRKLMAVMGMNIEDFSFHHSLSFVEIFVESM